MARGKRHLAAAAAGLCLAGCVSVTIDESTVFAPPEGAPAAASADLMRINDAEKLTAELTHGFADTSSNRIAWTLATRAGEDRPLIVMCYGNAADRRTNGVAYIRRAIDYGNVLIADYPGYGDSGGSPSAESITDMTTAIAGMANQLAGDRPLVFWGHSLGGFVCADMARRSGRAAGLVLETTARNVQEVGASWTPWYARPIVRLNIADSLTDFDNADLGAAPQPRVLVIGAGQDNQLDVSLSPSLRTALSRNGADITYLELAEAGHNDASQQAEFAPVAQAFFASLPRERPHAP